MSDKNRKEKYVFDVFQSIAGSYDSANKRISLGFHLYWKKTAIRRMCSGLPKGAQVLDIGCGTGDMLRLMNVQRPDLELTGVDFSPNMLKVAKERCGHIPGVRLEKGNALDLPFMDGSFSGVSISFALRNTADHSIALREAARVLKPGGRLLVIDSFVPESPLIRPFYGFYFSVIMPLVGGGFGKRKEYRWLTESTKRFVSVGGLKELMRAAGFSVRSERKYLFGACSYVLGVKRA